MSVNVLIVFLFVKFFELTGCYIYRRNFGK